MAANLHIMPYTYRHTALFLLSSSLLPIINVINNWRSKAVSTPSPPLTPILPIQSHNTPSPPLSHQTCQSCLHVYILLYYSQSYIITISCGRGICGGGGSGVCGCNGAISRGGCGGNGGGDCCD